MPLLDALAFDLQRRPDAPLHRQLFSRLAASIDDGSIRPGERLPSTRDLAQSLGVSRNTILLAFEQLTAEGYLEGQTGSGTYVSTLPPSNTVKAGAPRINAAIQAANDSIERTRSAFGDVPDTLRYMRRPVPFRANFPALDAFPVQRWAKLAANLYRRLDSDIANQLMGEGDAQGYAPLREQIALHAGLTRGIVCKPENVIIFAGAQHALDLACRLLLLPGDTAWCEDPGYDGAYAAITAASALTVPVPVDAEGIDVAAGMARDASARLAYVTPSKQFPLGMAMSMERRVQLLDWADRTGAWIVEDDYDCEFRYSGTPLPSLFDLGRGERVIYLGTFSKTLFPALRLGFAIVPDALIEPFVAARTVVGRYSPILEQVMVANFMADGQFSSHIRKMRRLYARRQAQLLALVARHLDGFLTAEPAASGMEIIATLAPGYNGLELARRAAQQGLEIMPLTLLAHQICVDRKITLGFSAFSEKQMEDGILLIRDIFRQM